MWPQFNDKMSWWKQNWFNVNTQPSGLQSAIPLNTAVNANQKEKNDDMAKLIKRLTFMWHIENMHSYKNTKASFQSSQLSNHDTWSSRIELFSIRLKNAFLWHFFSLLLLLLFFLCKFHIFRTFFPRYSSGRALEKIYFQFVATLWKTRFWMKPQNQCNSKMLGVPVNKPTKMNERREKLIDLVNIGRVNKYQLQIWTDQFQYISFWNVGLFRERIEYRKVLARFFLVCSV